MQLAMQLVMQPVMQAVMQAGEIMADAPGLTAASCADIRAAIGPKPRGGEMPLDCRQFLWITLWANCA